MVYNMKLPLFISSVVIILIYSFVLVSAETVSHGINNPTENYNHQVTIVPVFKISISLQSYILKILLAQFEARKNVSIQPNEVKCGIIGNWSRIAYFDTTQGDSCPTGLRTVTSTTTNQTACGRSISSPGCTSLNFSSGVRYSKVCGRVMGYQFRSPDAFHPSPSSIDSYYVDRISITSGAPSYHLWTYAAGASETVGTVWRCPCAREDYSHSDVPTFVGDHYYCESGFVTSWTYRIAWEDHLWDGNRCLIAKNHCCD